MPSWAQYAEDVIALLDHLDVDAAIVGGAGLGGTIALRTATGYPHRARATILISVEDIEDDEAKEAEIAFMEDFARRVRTEGIEAAWKPILTDLPPVIGSMVRDAIPRSDPDSICAAAAIGYDRSFRHVSELAVIRVPTLVIAGTDWRHPTDLAEEIVRVLPEGQRAAVSMSMDFRNSEDFANTLTPEIRAFLKRELVPRSGKRGEIEA